MQVIDGDNFSLSASGFVSIKSAFVSCVDMGLVAPIICGRQIYDHIE